MAKRPSQKSILFGRSGGGGRKQKLNERRRKNVWKYLADEYAEAFTIPNCVRYFFLLNFGSVWVRINVVNNEHHQTIVSAEQITKFF